MRMTNLLQSFFKPEQVNKSTGVEMRPGQIFRGKIMKLYPNQMAMVQFNGMRLHARLEAALSTNQHYLFQVQQNPQMVHLKVIGTAAGSERNSGSDGNGWLSGMGLEQTKHLQQTAEFLLKETIPFTKKELQSVSGWLSETKDLQQGKDAIRFMKERGLPFTKDVYTAVLSLQKEGSMSELLHSLKTELSALQPIQKQEVLSLTKVVDQLTVRSNHSNRLLVSVLALAMDPSADQDRRDIAKALLSKVGFVPEQLTEKGLSLAISRALPIKEDGSEAAKSTSPVADALRALWNEKSHQELHGFLVRLAASLQKGQGGSEQIPDMTRLLAGKLSNREQEVLQSASRAVDLLSSPALLSSMMKKLPLMMGMDFEAGLLRNGAAFQELADDTLKPLLLKALQQTDLPESLLSKMEQVTNRITGLQLLAGQDSGPLGQLILQIPLELGSVGRDLTVQWSGRRKRDGSIDPDYCRMVFYLELEHLREVSVDVQIQNRILSVTIYHDHAGLPSLVDGMKPQLSEGLEEINYHLSSIRVMNPGELSGGEHPVFQSEGDSFSPYRGVDIRI